MNVVMRIGVATLAIVAAVTASGEAAARERTQTQAYVDVGGDLGPTDDCVDTTVPSLGGACFVVNKGDRFVRATVRDATMLDPCAVLNFHNARGEVLPPHNVFFVGSSSTLSVPKRTATITVSVLQLSFPIFPGCGGTMAPGTAGNITVRFSGRRF